MDLPVDLPAGLEDFSEYFNYSSRPIWAGKSFGEFLKEFSRVPVLTPKITHFQAKVLVRKGFWRNSGAQNGTLPLKTQGIRMIQISRTLHLSVVFLVWAASRTKKHSENVMHVVDFDSRIDHLSSTFEHFHKNIMFLKTYIF